MRDVVRDEYEVMVVHEIPSYRSLDREECVS